MDTIKDQLSFYASSLQLRSRRNNILASNIANAATPNYKARDISFEDEIKKQDLNLLGWRDVPVNSKVVGSIASKTQPQIKQVFIKRNTKLTDKEFNLNMSVFEANYNLNGSVSNWQKINKETLEKDPCN